MKYWEIIADQLHAEGWSYGIAEQLTKHGLLFCVDAHRDGKRFIVKADDVDSIRCLRYRFDVFVLWRVAFPLAPFVAIASLSSERNAVKKSAKIRRR